MVVKFYKLGPKNPGQTGRGRRFDALYLSRTIEIPDMDQCSAYYEARAQAQPEEVVVKLGGHSHQPFEEYRTDRVWYPIKKHYQNRPGYIIESPCPELPPKRTATVVIDGHEVPMSGLMWLAISPGSVCVYRGKLYQKQTDGSMQEV